MAKLDAESIHLLDDARLISALKRALTLSAEAVQEAALLWNEARSRGLDLSFISPQTEMAFEGVIDGKLDPAAALAFGGSRARMRLVASLSKSDQRKLATGTLIPVVVLRGNEERTESIPGTQLKNNQLATVIGGGKIRSPFEQRAHLKQKAASPAEGAKRRVSIDLPEDVHARLLHQADRKKLPLSLYIAELLDWSSRGAEIGQGQVEPANEGDAA